jgi:hypothetical protein
MRLTGLTLRALLATALLMAGLPVHAAPGSVIVTSDVSPHEPFLQSTESADSDCPGHAESLSGPSLDHLVDAPEDCLAEGCCASDCGCNCMGLTLVIPLKPAALAMAIPGSGPVRTHTLPDPLIITALLRPPQA